MAPILHCVRHAQGYHNLTAANHSMLDPILTPYGEGQCATFAATFPLHHRISLVMASPLKRTIHTAFLCFQPALSNGHCAPTILALPEVQETTDFPCDTGSPVSVLQKACEEHGWPADLSLVPEGWDSKRMGSKWAPTSDAIASRTRDARVLIREKLRELEKAGIESPEVALVTHGGVLHYFTEDWEDNWAYGGTAWQNTDVRSYTFVSDDDPNATILETEESRKRRGKLTPQSGKEVQEQLFWAAMINWELQGLQNPTKYGLVNDKGQMKDMDATGQAPAVGVKVGA